MECKYMFMFTLKNLALKGLMVKSDGKIKWQDLMPGSGLLCQQKLNCNSQTSTSKFSTTGVTITPKSHEVNSMRPGDAYMHHWTRWSLVQTMACHLSSIISLPELMLNHCRLNPLEHALVKISIKIQSFPFKKIHLKISSAKRRPFCLSFNVLTG